MPPVPAICDKCGTVFPSGIVVDGAMRASFVGNKSGPCPNCGGMGSIPDGFYEFTGDTLRIISTWSVERLQGLHSAMVAARDAADPRAAVAALENEPGLAELARRLSPMRDAAAFWAFVAVVVAIITLLIASQGDSRITVNEQTVIEKVISQPSATAPQAVKQKRPPPPPKQRKPKGGKKRR